MTREPCESRLVCTCSKLFSLKISNCSVKDVTATYTRAPGKHGAKETSEEKYSKALKRKFLSLVGTPAWADLDRSEKKRKGGDEEEDEKFFRVSGGSAWFESASWLTSARTRFRRRRTCWTPRSTRS